MTMKILQEHKNSGVIITPPKEKDFLVGALTPSITLASADWRQYECDGEWQKDLTIDFETNACMSFTGVNNLATYLNWLLDTNQLPTTHISFLKDNGYIGQDGKVSLSPRFTAKMSGTTENGNDFQNVWESLRKDGVVPDSVWPMPSAQMNANPSQAWNLYYAEPSSEAVSLAKAFLTFFDVHWEWLVSNGNGATQTQYKEWLTVAPIHIAIAVCSPWNTALPIPGCGTGADHGVQLSNVEVGVVDNILDHYLPFDKQLEADYILSYAVRGYLTALTLPTPAPVAQTASQALTQAQEAITNLHAIQGPHNVVTDIILTLLAEVDKLVNGG